MATGNIFSLDEKKLADVEKIHLVQVRLECLKLAMQRQGANDPRQPLVIADELYAWVTGRGQASKTQAAR